MGRWYVRTNNGTHFLLDVVLFWSQKKKAHTQTLTHDLTHRERNLRAVTIGGRKSASSFRAMRGLVSRLACKFELEEALHRRSKAQSNDRGLCPPRTQRRMTDEEINPPPPPSTRHHHHQCNEAIPLTVCHYQRPKILRHLFEIKSRDDIVSRFVSWSYGRLSWLARQDLTILLRHRNITSQPNPRLI